jgi:Conserved TM helix/Mechanosensitive ion channel
MYESINLEAISIFLTAMQVAGAQSFMQPLTNSLNQFSTIVGQAAPRIVAALILLGVGYLAGRAIGWIVRKISDKMNLDEHWSRTGIGESIARAGWNLSRIISTAAKWFVYLFFISAAVNVLQFSQLSEAINSVWLWIPNVVAFIVVLAVGSVIADFAGRWMQRELPARGVVGGRFIGMAATGILYAIVLVVATTQLKIGEAVLNSVISALVWGLAAALAIGIGVGLAYGLREAIPSLIRGSTQIQPILRPGQRVTFDGLAGTIRQAGAFSIILRDDHGKTLIIPTKSIADRQIVIESGPSPDIEDDKVKSRSSANSSHSSKQRAQPSSTL